MNSSKYFRNGVQIGDKLRFDYTQGDVIGSVDFTGLSTSVTYSVYFYNECETGYSTVLEGLSGIKTKILVTGINFKTNIPSSLTMGSYVDIEAAVLPSNASNSSYTLSVSDGSYVSGNKTVVFNNAGKYRVTATSDENPNITITSSQIVVKLAAPIVKTSIVDEGFLIEWNEIAGATKYILTKTNNSADNTPKIIELTTNRYKDEDTNFSGITYYYTVKAICDDILSREVPVKVILIGGPSCSGKTTSARLLGEVLKDQGKKVISIEMDNFLNEDERIEMSVDELLEEL